MIIPAKSPQAKHANEVVTRLQAYFVSKLNGFSMEFAEGAVCEAISWERDEGNHGGGIRYEARDSVAFDRGSVNVSQVHYDDDETKKLSSATAISTIIHPRNPHLPSMHMHISWTQMRDGSGYWRVMADLNPSLLNESEDAKSVFDTMLQSVTGAYYEEGIAQGDRYFYIPVLGRHRGVKHFYLEGYNSGDFDVDSGYVTQVGESVVDAYIDIITSKITQYPTFTPQEREEQLAYHTLYLFQVLTLDRGTTSGLLIHDQNDVGIMGSIPSHINRALLQSWIEKMPSPQDLLVKALLDVLPNQNPTPVEEDTKKRLASAVREHYKYHPEAINMQASGEIIPPTVQNHR
jgi:coproporphyrinogen III oxidase